MTDRHPFRLLLVEDSPAHAELIVRSLEKVEPEIEVDHVVDGEQALQYLFGEGEYAEDRPPVPDLLLLDLNLPKLGGMAVLRETRANARTADVPIVVLTCSDNESDVMAAYDGYANSYLVKPMSFRELNTQMEAMTDYWVRRNVGPSPA